MERHFIDLNAEQVSALLEADSLPFFGRSQGFGWSKLLGSRRITIISEAGSGKTYECQKQQGRMFAEGEAAFFLELSELARVESAMSLLNPEQRVRFNQWASSSDQVATFFLDAYDELKLTQRRFRTALLNLQTLLGPRLDRIKLVVTSRPVPFERELLGQLFPVPEPPEKARTFVDDVMQTGTTEPTPGPKEKKPPLWRTVCLVPLDEAAIREFALTVGLKDPDSFLSDLHRRHAMDFARRPQDLIELCKDWQDHREVRSHRDQVETNVSVKLKPREDRPEPAALSAIKAREGAGDLALAALLTKRLTLRHSFGPGEEEAIDPALDPARILKSWTKDERQTLLERPLFSYASYGRVRFHHRSVIEFLAAERLLSLTKAGMTERALKRFLFARTPQGIDVVRPSFRPVAAWLSLHHGTIFAETLHREPETLISLADPSSFSDTQRTAILSVFVDRNRTGTWRGLHVPAIQTQRFATPSLGPCAQALWNSGIENGEMREFLLELAAAGPLPELADAAVSVFLNAGSPDPERIDALRAILSLGDKRLPEIVQTLAREPARWTNRVLQYAVVELFPDHMQGENLKAVLAALKPSKSSIDSITWNWPNDIKETRCRADVLATLRQMLLDLVLEDASWNKDAHRLQSSRAHFVPALAATCLKELQAGVALPDLVFAAVTAVRFKTDRDYNDDRPVSALRKALVELSAEDRALVFWQDDALMQTFRPKEDQWARFFEVWHEGVISIDPEKDRAWVLAAVADRNLDPARRYLALEAALRATRPQESEDARYLANLSSFAEDSAELSAELERFLAPRVPDPRTEVWAERSRKEKAERDEKTERARQSWESLQKRILADPAAAFQGPETENICWNLWSAMRRGVEQREVGWDRGFIERHFNRETADRLRRSMMERWRTIHPPLEYERPAAERGTYYYSWHFALACLYAEAEDPNWAKALTAAEAAQAARIATVKLNGLPPWLADLAKTHPSTLEQTLGPDLSAGLEEAKSWSSYLQALRDADPSLRNLFVPRIVVWLNGFHDRLVEGVDRESATNLLRQALHVLLAVEDQGLAGLIKSLAIQALSGAMEDPAAIIWAQILLRLDPEHGTAELERLFGSTPAPSKVVKEAWIAQLFGDRHGSGIPVDLGAAGFSPALLLRLVLLAYAHIRQADDVHHEGTFSPDTRDEAQNGRSTLLSALLDREGPDAWQAKLQLADDPLLAHFRDRTLALAREKGAAEADSMSFTEAEAAGLVKQLEPAPKTRDDMFALLSDRLDDLEDMLLTDASPREIWTKADKEYLLRREIARTLGHMANGVYIVDQEAVTADEKETDIRLFSTGSAQQGVIELKRAEGFSGKVLFETISDQLAHRYLAPENRRAGILVITLASDRKFEHPETGVRLDVDVFLALLRREAERVEQHLGFTVRIGVRILDLRPRLAKV